MFPEFGQEVPHDEGPAKAPRDAVPELKGMHVHYF
jgi:hypothetical protein